VSPERARSLIIGFSPVKELVPTDDNERELYFDRWAETAVEELALEGE
jgi:hypothetical protein